MHAPTHARAVSSLCYNKTYVFIVFSDTPPLRVDDEAEVCNKSCGAHAQCHCDVLRGVTQCMCHKGYYLGDGKCKGRLNEVSRKNAVKHMWIRFQVLPRELELALE